MLHNYIFLKPKGVLFFGEVKPTAIAVLSGSINGINGAMMIQTLPTFAATGSFPFQLTQQQQKALDAMWTFIQPDERIVLS